MAGAKPRTAAPSLQPNSSASDFPLDASIGYQVRIAHRRFTQQLDARLNAEGLSVGMWYFLRVLWEEDGLTQRQLAERVGLEAPATVEQLRNMEKRGLIERRRSAEDRRKIHVHLTADGAALKPALLPYAQQVVGAALAGFSREEIDALRAMLLRVQRNLDREQAD